MKLRNKKTGEIKEYGCVGTITFNKDGKLKGFSQFDSLADLTKEWEDYEETKDYCYVDELGDVYTDTDESVSVDKERKEIGNYFETKEEAEKAVKKLMAWKRLKDKGFEFRGYTGWDYGENVDIQTSLTTDDLRSQQETIIKDLDLLFGGEE